MKVTIGIDEVGRGPIAGPVCVCAFQFKIQNSKQQAKKFGLPLRDSKKLSKVQRERWFKVIKSWQKEGKCDFAISYVSANKIDKIGIAPAIKFALKSSLYKLVNPKSNPMVLLDGGLRAPVEFKNQKTIIKGDEKEFPIMFASIVAKVSRDKLMTRYSKKFLQYGFEKHSGYGTKAHYKAIKKHGFTPLHRKSFLSKLNLKNT